MRRLLAFWLTVLLLLLAGSSRSLAAPPAAPDAYTLEWWTVNAGGGTSKGGAYALSGTAGQPDSGIAMVGGTYTLVGGFWNGAVQGLSGYRPINVMLPILKR